MKGYEERCLCNRCKDDYETAGYKLKRVYEYITQDRCDKCERLGWVYTIQEGYAVTTHK